MAEHKRLTEVALKKKREAAANRRIATDKGESGYIDRRLAALLESEAAEIVSTYEPPIVHMGEVSRPHIIGMPNQKPFIDTLPKGDLVAEEASITRTDLLLQNNIDISALAVDAADSIQAQNSMEKMLSHQMALAHSMAMKIGDAAMGQVTKLQNEGRWNSLEPGAATELQRLTNSVTRLMGTYQQGLLTLQKLRTGGNQTVTVQHVSVGAGGQAVIGNVQTGGHPLEGEEQKNG